MKAILTGGGKPERGGVSLPSDYTTYLPPFVLQWLNKYSIDDFEIRKHKFGWSDSRHSLVMPVMMDGDLAMYQLRYFGTDPKEPKYRTYGFKNDVIFIPKEHDAQDLIVLVEDYISAIKVGRVTNSMPIFGSMVSSEVMYRLSKMFKRARIWLDPDKNVQAIKSALVMNSMGLSTTTIFSDRDPKEYITPDIRKYINLIGDE